MEIQGSGLCSFTPLRFRQKKAPKSELSAQCWKETRSKINEESLQSPSGKMNLVLSTALPRLSPECLCPLLVSELQRDTDTPGESLNGLQTFLGLEVYV